MSGHGVEHKDRDEDSGLMEGRLNVQRFLLTSDPDAVDGAIQGFTRADKALDDMLANPDSGIRRDFATALKARRPISVPRSSAWSGSSASATR